MLSALGLDACQARLRDVVTEKLKVILEKKKKK